MRVRFSPQAPKNPLKSDVKKLDKAPHFLVYYTHDEKRRQYGTQRRQSFTPCAEIM